MSYSRRTLWLTFLVANGWTCRGFFRVQTAHNEEIYGFEHRVRSLH